MVNYIPSKGDIVTLDFDPQKGHEQKGRRPALILREPLIINYQEHFSNLSRNFS